MIITTLRSAMPTSSQRCDDIVCPHRDMGIGDKFDLLGLKQLTIFDKTLKAIERNYGKKIKLKDLYKINLEDRKIYEVLNSGRLQSIFQMTGTSASMIVNQMKPQCFEDIMVAESICRPGVDFSSSKTLLISGNS